jgi:hypothetical protein
VRARAQGDPVEIDSSGCERGGHAGSLRASPLRPSPAAIASRAIKCHRSLPRDEGRRRQESEVRDPAAPQPAEVQKSRLPRVVRLVCLLHAPSSVGGTCESWRGGGDGGDSSMDRRGGAVLRAVRIRDQYRGASVKGTARSTGAAALTVILGPHRRSRDAEAEIRFAILGVEDDERYSYS